MSSRAKRDLPCTSWGQPDPQDAITIDAGLDVTYRPFSHNIDVSTDTAVTYWKRVKWTHSPRTTSRRCWTMVRLVRLHLHAHQRPAPGPANVIRLKNLLQKAEEELVARGMRRPEALALLSEARALLLDAMFWSQQSDGMAVLVSPTLTATYRMPVSFEELLVVNKDFHLKPLLPTLAGDGRFYLLALSQKAVRLLEGTRDSIEEVQAESLPRGWQRPCSTTSAAHPSSTRFQRLYGRARSLMFHGQAGRGVVASEILPRVDRAQR